LALKWLVDGQSQIRNPSLVGKLARVFGGSTTSGGFVYTDHGGKRSSLKFKLNTYFLLSIFWELAQIGGKTKSTGRPHNGYWKEATPDEVAEVEEELAIMLAARASQVN